MIKTAVRPSLAQGWQQKREVTHSNTFFNGVELKLNLKCEVCSIERAHRAAQEHTNAAEKDRGSARPFTVDPVEITHSWQRLKSHTL